jgi:hypothetical protein
MRYLAIIGHNRPAITGKLWWYAGFGPGSAELSTAMRELLLPAAVKLAGLHGFIACLHHPLRSIVKENLAKIAWQMNSTVYKRDTMSIDVDNSSGDDHEKNVTGSGSWVNCFSQLACDGRQVCN